MESLPPDEATPPVSRTEPPAFRLPELFAGFKHRRMYQVVLGYAVGAWLVLQVCAVVLPGLEAPKWLLRAVIVLAQAGLGGALLAGWMLDRRTTGKTLLPRGARALGFVLLALLPATATAVYFLARPGLTTAGANPFPRVPSAAPSLADPIPDKSIAVLPFANLSDEKTNGYFTDGVQDEILTDLAKVADLKVISRTSVMQYRGGVSRNLREIATQLGVAHVLEGSVQRADNMVRVSAQLIDARTDSHQWAEQFDRPVDHVFAIQSEIAQAIADQLRARISPDEHAAMAEQPTANVGALEQYERGKEIVERYLDADDERTELLQAVDLLEDANRRDPGFVEAYCYAARAHDILFFAGIDATPARQALAETAVNTALRLRPGSGEAHLAAADFYFRCHHDFARAEEELAVARPKLPNSAPLHLISGYLDRRLARWNDGIREFEKAGVLDPRNANAFDLLYDSYVLLRRFADAERAAADAGLRNHLDPRFTEVNLAAIEFAATGGTKRLSAALGDLPGYIDPGGSVTPLRVIGALAVGDYQAANAALTASPLQAFQDVDYSFYYPRTWYEAQIARAAGDETRAHAAFSACRQVLAARPEAQAEDPRTLAVIAQTDAGLRDKEKALREGLRAVELMPISKDAYDGPLVLQGLAQVYLWAGDYPRAMDAVETLVRLPGYLTYGYLLKDPMWAPLRGNPRFETLVESLAPR